jgi:hypothetical protein
MKRRLLNLLTVLSLLLCVALVAAWVVGFFAGWSAFYGGGYDSSDSRWGFRVVVVHEGVVLRVIHSHRVNPAYRGGNFGFHGNTWRREGGDMYEAERTRSHGIPPLLLWGTGRGQDYLDRVATVGARDTLYFLIVSPLILALLAGVPPALWLARSARGRRRTRRGLCPRCGYDLRATPGRCPECGTAGSPAGG